ncbi:UPF0182 family protein [candidate division KSB1 bacterium]|nr:UPF0182 family protein [candidate division KSB1 bacterium]
MYLALLFILLGLSIFLAVRGFQQQKRSPVFIAILLAGGTILFYWFMGFYGEWLWFVSLGYESRFWTEIVTKLVMVLVGLALGFGISWVLTLKISGQVKGLAWVARFVSALVAGMWASANWDVVLLFLNQASSEVTEPILNHSASFYLFTLPFFNSIYGLFFILTLFSLLAAIFSRVRESNFGDTKSTRPLFVSFGAFLITLALGKWLARYQLLYSDWGVVSGPGWTDVHIRLWAYPVVVIITLAAALFIAIPYVRNRGFSLVPSRWRDQIREPVQQVIAMGLVVFAVWLVFLTFIPRLVQWLRVEPNEITLEKPYIEHNIEFTRHAFALDRVEEREFPAKETLEPAVVDQNPHIFKNIRLWDYRALDAVYKQFQEIRLYYVFTDVDIDRYTFNGQYRQLMVSARELQQSSLPEQSKTFVNRRFIYTHGFGLTMTNVAEFTPQGLPHLLVKDIPPKSEYPALEVKRPEIYYGEETVEYVVANSAKKEFDYPSGEQNVYTRYEGTGGVQLSNVWRKWLFGWKFDGTRFFLSEYPTNSSRILFHREIMNRVQTVAPFLQYDNDPYIALIDGRLVWIIDAFTTSDKYPYSEPYTGTEAIEYREGDRTRMMQNREVTQFAGKNYVRNSVKVFIDAYNGDVDFYIYEPDDPLVQTWQNIFPELFKSKQDLPDEFKAHVRYPSDYLLLQGLIYAKYHMTDPTVFYNQEDLWIRATEKYYNQVQPVEPYYIMWELPETDHAEFVLMLPFTPKNRQVMIGWIAGMCDPGNYGRFLAYKFPKEKRVLGPQQVETKIDQDSYLSGQLTLWDQRGSNVIRGNVLAIPIEESVLYVEPIYLQAETAAYPELRLVAVMHNDNLSYAESFDKALEGLFAGQPQRPTESMAPAATMEESIGRANQAFNEYLQAMGQKDFSSAQQALQELQNALESLNNRIGQ